jgi:hypothetical protein
MNLHLNDSPLLPLTLALLAANSTTRADFVPIPLNPETFNQDVVVERAAPPPVIPTTTASMETGTNNTGYSLYERGYNVIWATTGLPTAGARFTSEAQVDHDYQFAPTYKTNNAVLIDSAITSGTLTLSDPAAFANLSFLTSAAGGGGGGGVIAYTVHHEDGSTDSGTFRSPDWLGAFGQAWTTHGRVEVTAFTFSNIGGDYPRIYSRDIALTHTLSPVTTIDLSYTAGSEHTIVFGVSGAPLPGDPFTPLRVTGFNQDMVVEAAAAKPGFLGTATTASLESGTDNTLNTWYEQGYVTIAPTTGLPPAGAILTNSVAPDHRYLMPPTYIGNNAVLVDPAVPSAWLTPATPLACSALSFLGAAGHGPVTNAVLIQHADGSSETNFFVLPDWLDNSAGAFNVNGRINLNNRIVNAVNSGWPRLFASDVAVANATSAITNVVVSFIGGGVNSHAVLFAVSGRTDSAPARPTISIVRNPNGTLTLGSTGPGRLESATALNGTNTVWHDEGPIATTVTVTPAPAEQAKFYRVIAQ